MRCKQYFDYWYKERQLNTISLQIFNLQVYHMDVLKCKCCALMSKYRDVLPPNSYFVIEVNT